MQPTSVAISLAALFCLLPSTASAAAIPLGVWEQFSFQSPGTQARGCDPADPAGAFCVPSSGTPTQFLPAPPWTFTSANAITLIVVDAFDSGDRFEIFDFGASLGLTSLPAGPVNCGDDPVPCLATPGMSSATFGLAPGNHSITIFATNSPGGLGSGFLIASDVPEPMTAALAGSGLLLLAFLHRKRA